MTARPTLGILILMPDPLPSETPATTDASHEAESVAQAGSPTSQAPLPTTSLKAYLAAMAKRGVLTIGVKAQRRGTKGAFGGKAKRNRSPRS